VQFYQIRAPPATKSTKGGAVSAPPFYAPVTEWLGTAFAGLACGFESHRGLCVPLYSIFVLREFRIDKPNSSCYACPRKYT
jgi:hypothetical protein